MELQTARKKIKACPNAGRIEAITKENVRVEEEKDWIKNSEASKFCRIS